jgi:hypothetical protein
VGLRDSEALVGPVDSAALNVDDDRLVSVSALSLALFVV